MQIAGYLKTSLIEWPGKISSVVFTQGCNFRCPFCHNRELVEKQRRKPACRQGRDAKKQSFKEEEVLRDLESRKKWVDAVVITGGEPTLQKDLPEFLGKLGKLGMLRMIHTNGTRPETIAKLLSCYLVDYVAMDIKGDLEEYEKYIGSQKSKVKSQNYHRKCGIPLRRDKSKVKSSIEIIAASGVEYEFRTTVVPGLHNLGNLSKLAKQMQELYAGQKENLRSKEAKKQSHVPDGTWQRSKEKENSETRRIGGKLCVSESSPRWYLQQFRPMNTLDKKFLKVKPFSKEEMEGFQKELQKIIPNTCLRGV